MIFAYNPDLLNVLPAGSRLLPYSHLFPDKIAAEKRASNPGAIRIALRRHISVRRERPSCSTRS